jgi:uncharacterized protein (UPF0147 family)
MGRRSVATMADADKARKVVAKRFMALVDSGSGINIAQFAAQLHEQEAVEFFVSIMRDATVPTALRIQCAEKIVLYARGPVIPWEHDRKTIDPGAFMQTGLTVSQQIEAAKAQSALHQRLDELVRRNVHPSEWPHDVREIAGDLIAGLEAAEEAERMRTERELSIAAISHDVDYG